MLINLGWFGKLESILYSNLVRLFKSLFAYWPAESQLKKVSGWPIINSMLLQVNVS